MTRDPDPSATDPTGDDEVPELELFTCRYQRFQPSMGLPVRTTVHPPRWRLHYALAGYVRELAPTAAMLDWPLNLYRDEYHARLHRHGLDLIRRRLQAIADQHGDHRVVLLCFDDLSKPGAWCHRRLFADWWTARTGEAVPELAELPNPKLF